MNTTRTRNQLVARYPDNTTGRITAQDGRDFIVSAFAFPSLTDPGHNNDSIDTAGIGAYFDTSNLWLNRPFQKLWVCVDGSPGAAVWAAAGGGPSPVSTANWFFTSIGIFIGSGGGGVAPPAVSFGAVYVAGESFVIAAIPADTLTLARGRGIELRTDAVFKEVEISTVPLPTPNRLASFGGFLAEWPQPVVPPSSFTTITVAPVPVPPPPPPPTGSLRIFVQGTSFYYIDSLGIVRQISATSATKLGDWVRYSFPHTDFLGDDYGVSVTLRFSPGWGMGVCLKCDAGFFSTDPNFDHPVLNVSDGLNAPTRYLPFTTNAVHGGSAELVLAVPPLGTLSPYEPGLPYVVSINVQNANGGCNAIFTGHVYVWVWITLPNPF